MTEDLLRHYRDVLAHEGYQVEVGPSNTLNIALQIQEQEIDVECTLPETFPYQFPLIRLSERASALCAEFAHRFEGDYLCLFSQADARPGFRYPDQLLLATVKKAEVVLTDGFVGDNTAEFEKEILEYWNKKTVSEFRAFSEFPAQISQFCAYYIKEKYFVLAENKSHLDAVVANIFHDQSQSKPLEFGLHIPLSRGFTSHDVTTEKELWKVISERTTSKERQMIHGRMRAMHNRCKLFVVSFPAEDGQRIFLGWVSTGIKSLPGFRKDHISPFTYWGMQSNGQLCKILATMVTNCSQEYLYQRGGYGFDRRLESATIVGCGSVGSELAVELSSMGTSQFLLIDNEDLSTDNIARHVCGYDFVGLNKAHAMKFFLQHANPNIKCEAFVNSAFQEVIQQVERINQTQCVFVAVGDIAIEAFILKLAEDGKINCPLIIAWVEPRCYAGHLIYITKPKGALDALIDPATLTYRNTVIQENSFVKHVPGCSTGYIPYSGLDVKQFISRSLHELAILREYPQLQGNYHYIWVGEISEARRQNIRISDDYADVHDFCFLTKRFD